MFSFAVASILLIDFDNVASVLGEQAFVKNVDRWLAWLEAGEFDPRRRRRRFDAKRVYWNGQHDRHRAPFENKGFDAFACRAEAKSKKSSADIVITLDAMDLISERRGLKEVILLSTDTDFVPVVNRLQDKGLRVAAMANEDNRSAAVYRDHADLVISKADMVRALAYAPPDPAAKRARRAKPAPAAPAPRGAPKPPPRDALALAAEAVEKTAAETPGAQISRKTVTRVLRRIDGFAAEGPAAWFGQGSYAGLLAVLAKRSQRLKLYRFRNGGVAVAYRGEQADS